VRANARAIVALVEVEAGLLSFDDVDAITEAAFENFHHRRQLGRR